jgi:hypothetical protein
MSDVDTDVSPTEGTGATTPAPAGKQGRRRLVLAVGAVVLVVAAGGAAYATRQKPAKDHTLTGTLVMSDNNTPDVCNPTDTYSDVSDGAPISVSDGDDKVVATSTLGRGTPDTVPFNPDVGSSRTAGSYKVCRHAFKVVVPDTKYYRIVIGKRAIAYAKADLVSKNWAIILNLSPPPTGAG